MKAELRFAKPKTDMKIKETKQHVSIGSAENIFFKPKGEVTVGLFPIPEWLKQPKCYLCPHPAKYLLVDASPICSKCLDTMLVGTNVKMREADTSVPITIDIISHSRFEWSTDGEKWYSIWGKNLKPDHPELFLIEMRRAVLSGQPILVECDYDKENKAMRIY